MQIQQVRLSRILDGHKMTFGAERDNFLRGLIEQDSDPGEDGKV